MNADERGSVNSLNRVPLVPAILLSTMRMVFNSSELLPDLRSSAFICGTVYEARLEYQT